MPIGTLNSIAKVYVDPNKDRPIIVGYKGGTIKDAVANAKSRGEDVGAFDEDHPYHHLVMHLLEGSGESASFYAPYKPLSAPSF